MKFVEKGIKINADYYQTEILESVLIPKTNLSFPNANSLYPGGAWTFQQDSAPAHRAKTTQNWVSKNCPGFISTKEWPPASPDLNYLDFAIWETVEAKVNAKQHQSMASLKHAILQERDQVPVNGVDAAISSWRH